MQTYSQHRDNGNPLLKISPLDMGNFPRATPRMEADKCVTISFACMLFSILEKLGTDSGPVVSLAFEKRLMRGEIHTQGGEKRTGLEGGGMIGRRKGKKRLADSVFKMADNGQFIILEDRPFQHAYLSQKSSSSLPSFTLALMRKGKRCLGRSQIQSKRSPQVKLTLGVI